MELAHLAERVEPRAPRPRLEGAFVMYWMRTGLRATENPALDVALRMGSVLKRPVFVYHGLSERYRYASDRHHTFILESARDVQRAFRERGIGYAFHLERVGHREPQLRRLAEQAALVVTELHPVPPMFTWDAQVARLCPLWRVDTSCVAPTWLLDRTIERLSIFRDVMDDAWAARLARRWHDVEPEGPPFLPELPFTPLDLTQGSLEALVAVCNIDHGIAPVHHTPGGSTAALERWHTFAEERLAFYQRDRSDPLREGTSRMSAYLHYGNIWAGRLARDCLSHGTDGARAFLDELMVKREMAFHFCRRIGEVGVEALPQWAQETLRLHESDSREALPSWDQLARAHTGQVLWDTCQRSLLTHGELHPALRVIWAKALIGWTRTAGEALQLILDLNNRYALDGRDPSSYAGALASLGAFEEPATTERPVFGRVRPASLEEEAQRHDISELARRSRRATRGRPLTVAVVGAGLAGAACARALVDAAHAVTVFERAPAPGGRAASWVDPSEPNRRFDHGAQYFRVRDERFAQPVRAFRQERVVSEWHPKIAALGRPRSAPGAASTSHQPSAGTSGQFVATPEMGSLVQRLLSDIDVRCDTTVAAARREEHWTLADAQGAPLGEYEVLVVAVPAPLAVGLLDGTSLAPRLREARLAPCWSVVLELPEPVQVDFDAAFVHVGPLSWVALDSSRPERSAGEKWVLHASSRWSARHLSTSASEVVRSLLAAFLSLCGAPAMVPLFSRAHLWPHARVVTSLGVPCLWDESYRLAACGDWCLEGRIEAAFLSGTAAAGRINAIPHAGEPEPVSRPIRRQAQLRLL